MIDDSPEKHVLNYSNLVRVSPFLGDSVDDELLALLPYVAQLDTEPNVRVVDKRNWRS